MASPFNDTAMRPLTLAHLCAIYSRLKKIPEKPKTIYRKVVKLLLEDWDEQRRIERRSSYRDFETDDKIEFLSHLSYMLTAEFKAVSFSTYNLKICYSRICSSYGLPSSEKEMKLVIDEIESHNGLIIRAGFDKYQFAHKSIQEYLAADYIIRLHKLPEIHTLLSIPNELAVTVSLSSNPSQFFGRIVFKELRSEHVNMSFMIAFITRISIEKPKFTSNPLLAAALIFLGGNSINENEYSTNLMLILENLINDQGVYESVKNVHSLYSPESNSLIDYERSKGSIKLHLNRSIGLANELNLPKYLIAQGEFAEIYFKWAI